MAKHYIDKLIDQVEDAVEDGNLHGRRARLRDDVIALIEREKEEAVAAVKREVENLKRENGKLRNHINDLTEVIKIGQ